MNILAEERNEEVSQPLMEAGQALGKKGAKKLGSKVGAKVAGAAKKAVANIGKVAVKAGAALVKGFVAAIIPLLPYILMVLGIGLLTYFTYDVLVETRPQNQEYQTEEMEETNTYSDIPDDEGYLQIEKTSQGNALVKLFYTYFSDQSYWIVTEDFDDLTKPISPLDPEVEAKDIKDKYGREKMFYLSPDTLFTLDELLHRGEFKAPEQFIQPVPYEVDDDKNIKLKDIYDNEKEKYVVKSTKYDDDGKATDEKTIGVWDYGFAPVFHYKNYEEQMQYRGAVTQIQKWDKDRQEAVWVSATGDDLEGKESKVTDLGEVWLIDQVVSAGGTIKNDIKHEWRDTGEPWLPDIKDYVFGKKVDIRTWPLVHQKDDEGRLLYYQDEVDDEGNLTGKTYLSHVESSKPYKMVEETWTKETRTFHKKVEGTRWENIPIYDGAPDFSGVTGTKYYTDYMKAYKTYLPKEVLTEFNIAKRLDEGEDELLAAVTSPEPTDEGSSSSTVTSADVENLQLGSNASNSTYMKALENLHYFERYGDMYGVDPYLLIALTAQEAGGSHYNPNGTVKSAANIGLMQIAKLKGNTRSVTTHNFETGANETFTANYSQLHDEETNIKWGVMYLASILASKDNDVPTALQSYNFGPAYEGPWSVASALEQQQKFAEGKRRANPNSPLGPYAHGDAYYVPHVLRYYASPNTPVPYSVKSDGTIVAMGDTQLDMGTVDSINSNIMNTQSKGLWSTLASHIKFGWNELKEGLTNAFGLAPKNAVQFHGTDDDEPRLEVNMGQNPDEAWETTMSMLAYQEGNPLSYYESFTEDQFKERYKLLFTNPFGGSITDTKQSGEPMVNPKDFFGGGDFTSPVSKGKIAGKFGFIDDDGKQVYHPGVDVTVTKGQDIVAVAAGTVISVETGKNAQVVIQHAMGTVTTYSYVGDITVKKGHYVRKGDVIAKGGDSKERKGTFHFELNQHGRTKDPSWIVEPATLQGAGSIVLDPSAKGLFQTPFAGAPYYFTSGFGGRIDPQSKKWAQHNGIDIVDKRGQGAPVRSIADGTVLSAGWNKISGNYVAIDHGIIPDLDSTRRLYTYSAHLVTGSLLVKAGDKVTAGQQIGQMGTTGKSTGPHLHFGTSLGTSYQTKQYFDPTQVMDIKK